MPGSLPGAATSSFGFGRSGLPLGERVAVLARRLWPAKTARHLSARAGVTHRAAEQWLALQTGLSAEALAELIRSDVGFQVLCEVMGDAAPSWWAAFQRDVRAADIAERIEAARADLAALRADARGPGVQPRR